MDTGIAYEHFMWLTRKLSSCCILKRSVRYKSASICLLICETSSSLCTARSGG